MNYIIFEKNEKIRKLITTSIKQYLYGSKDHYNIYEYDILNKETLLEVSTISGFNIYILDTNVQKSVRDNIVSKIRKIDKYKNPIILIHDDKIDVLKYIKENMIFDLIKIDDNFFKNISNTLTKVYELSNNESVFSFEYYDEIYRIPYRSIYFFEKNSNTNSITLHTKHEDFIFYSTINDVMDKLKDDDRFIKTHRSVIVNIHKIDKFDKVYNEIIFDNNDRLPIVCRRQKQNLINKLLNKINI